VIELGNNPPIHPGKCYNLASGVVQGSRVKFGRQKRCIVCGKKLRNVPFHFYYNLRDFDASSGNDDPLPNGYDDHYYH